MIYLSGKILHILESQVVIRTSSSIGYLLYTNPSHKYYINDNAEFYTIMDSNVVGPNQKIYAFDSFDEWLLMRQMATRGLPIEISTKVVHELGVGQLQKAIATNDDSLLKRIPNLVQKQIRTIMEIGDECMNLSKSSIAPMHPNQGIDLETAKNGGENEKQFVYSASEFTEKMSQLGYARNKIVETISALKAEEVWGKMSLVDLVKKSMALIEDGYL
jgi:Holliday junction resolvasome RuvABC DNA-binding subunit